VKPSDLGEYEANAMEKKNIQYTRQSINSPSNQVKSQASPQTKANHKLPLKPSNVDGKHHVSNSRG
jgi:hypothetical protein